MNNNVKRLIKFNIFFVLSLFFLANFVLGAPEITIVSPENTTYDGGKLLVNVTSTEPVTFFMKEGDRDIILAENVENLQYDIYGRAESFNLEIWANNSNGEDNNSVAFSMNYITNPIQITGCGTIATSDTHYELANDLNCGGGSFIIGGAKNVSLNLKGYKIEGSGWISFRISESPNVEVFNGEIIGDVSAGTVALAIMGGSSAYLHDLNIEGDMGIATFWYATKGLLAENIYITAAEGIANYYTLINSEFRNITIDYIEGPYAGDDAAIHDYGYLNDVILEDIKIVSSEFPVDFRIYNTESLRYFIRNMNLSSEDIEVINNNEITDYNLYKQKLLKINVTDQNGNGIPASIEINDFSETIPLTEDEKRYKLDMNPTEKLLESTDSTGKTEVWLTERTYRYESFDGSPITFSEHTFDPYTVTVRSGSAVETFNVTFGDSEVIQKDIIFQLAEDLQDCSLQQSLDLNGDSSINIQDAVLVLRYITGQSVALNEAKDCKSWSLFAE